MKKNTIKKDISSKIFMMNSFIYTTTLPTCQNPSKILQHRVTSHFLQSVIMELIIKIFYEIDFKKSAPHTHDLLKIFNQFESKSKIFIEKKFNEAIERKKKIFKDIKNVKFHSFSDTLTSNGNIIKDFKYDAMGSKTNSSVDMIFYKEILDFINKKIEKI